MMDEDDDDHVTDDQALLSKTQAGNISSVSWTDENYEKSSLAIQNDPNYFIDHQKCGGCCRGYMRQDWDTLTLEHGLEEKKAEWIELFFDLIFVACIVRISYEAMSSVPAIDVGTNHEETITVSEHRRLSDAHYEPYCGEDQGGYDFLFCCFAQFGLLTVFWTEQTMMETHFILNQIMDYIFRLGFMSFILTMGIFIQDNPWHHQVFQVSYIGLKLMCIIMYSKVSMIQKANTHAIYHIIECSIVIIGLIFVIVYYEGCAIDYFAIYCGFFAFEYLFLIILEWSIFDKKTNRLRFALPLHIGHIAERFGLFIMLILGESIISLLAVAELPVLQDLNELIINVTFILFTFFMTFMIATLYYDSQPSEEAIMHKHDSHALKTKNTAAKLLYLIAHQILFFGLLAVGVGIKIAGHHLFDEYISREWVDVLLPSYGVVVIIICLFVIRATHPNKKKKIIIWVIRFVLLIVMCVIPLFGTQINQAIVFFVIFICLLLLVIVDVEGREQRVKKHKELKHKREEARQKSIEQMASKQLNEQELNQLSDQ